MCYFAWLRNWIPVTLLDCIPGNLDAYPVSLSCHVTQPGAQMFNLIATLFICHFQVTSFDYMCTPDQLMLADMQ